MAEIDDKTDKTQFRKIKPSPTAGLFGFAGATRFQPGQKEFDPDAANVPFEPHDGEPEPKA